MFHLITNIALLAVLADWCYPPISPTLTYWCLHLYSPSPHHITKLSISWYGCYHHFHPYHQISLCLYSSTLLCFSSISALSSLLFFFSFHLFTNFLSFHPVPSCFPNRFLFDFVNVWFILLGDCSVLFALFTSLVLFIFLLLLCEIVLIYSRSLCVCYFCFSICLYLQFVKYPNFTLEPFYNIILL